MCLGMASSPTTAAKPPDGWGTQCFLWSMSHGSLVIFEIPAHSQVKDILSVCHEGTAVIQAVGMEIE